MHQRLNSLVKNTFPCRENCAAAEAELILQAFAAPLKRCPDANRETEFGPIVRYFWIRISQNRY